MLKRLGIIGLVVGCLGCSPTTEAPQAKKSPVYGAWGVDLAAQNSEIHPGDDFHDFANGLWLTNHPIPAERSSWGSFFLLREQAEARVRAVIESLDGPDLEPGSPEQKVGDYFRSWMNVEALDQRLRAVMRSSQNLAVPRSLAAVHLFMPMLGSTRSILMSIT